MGTVLKFDVSILPVNKIVSTQICPGERRRNKIIYTFSLAMRKLPTISVVKSEVKVDKRASKCSITKIPSSNLSLNLVVFFFFAVAWK